MTGIRPDLDPSGVVAFSGTRAACDEFALVLAARGLPYGLRFEGGGWSLWVPAETGDAALEELARYAAERAGARAAARGGSGAARAPFPAGQALGGAVAYVGLLLGIAFLAGIDAWRLDWYAAGELDAGSRQWWRAVTALTLHAGPEHLLGNLLFGTWVGVLASRLFGAGFAWAGILAAGAAGNLLDMLVAPADHRALGASTAVFGGLGLLSGFGWLSAWTPEERWRRRAMPLLAGVSLLAMLGAGTEHVVLGNQADFGGDDLQADLVALDAFQEVAHRLGRAKDVGLDDHLERGLLRGGDLGEKFFDGDVLGRGGGGSRLWPFSTHDTPKQF